MDISVTFDTIHNATIRTFDSLKKKGQPESEAVVNVSIEAAVVVSSIVLALVSFTVSVFCARIRRSKRIKALQRIQTPKIDCCESSTRGYRSDSDTDDDEQYKREDACAQKIARRSAYV